MRCCKMRHLIVVFMIDKSFNYDKNLFNGLEITTGKVDHDELIAHYMLMTSVSVIAQKAWRRLNANCNKI